MIRTATLQRRSPLRRSRFMRSNRRSKYRRRERDFEFMGWVKRQPCLLCSLPPYLFMQVARTMGFKALTPCAGVVEADHLGARGIGQKADDRTCVSLCSKHHRERHDHAGSFRPLTKPELRAWRARAIEMTQAAWSNR